MNIAFYMLLSAVAAVVPVTIIFFVTMKIVDRAHKKEVEYIQHTRQQDGIRNREYTHQLHEDLRVLANVGARFTSDEIKAIQMKWRDKIHRMDSQRITLRDLGKMGN